MGSYNTSYENYYSNLKSEIGTGSKLPLAAAKKKKKSTGSFIARRVVQELVGVLVLFIFVLSIKSLKFPQAQKIYDYSKGVLGKNYDYISVWGTIKGVKINTLTNEAEEYLDEIISKVLGRETTKESVQKNYIIPVSGEVYKPFGTTLEGFSSKTKEGVIYSFTVPQEIKCSFQGTVKKVAEDKELGQYVVVDHENGIETKYFFLEEVSVVEGQKVVQGQSIGKILSVALEDKGYLYFQILSTGEARDPEEYISLKQVSL